MRMIIGVIIGFVGGALFGFLGAVLWVSDAMDNVKED